MLRFLICIVAVGMFGVTYDTMPADAQPRELVYQLTQVHANVRSELHMAVATLARDCRELPHQLRSLWTQADTQARSLRADLRADTHHLTATISRSGDPQ